MKTQTDVQPRRNQIREVRKQSIAIKAVGKSKKPEKNKYKKKSSDKEKKCVSTKKDKSVPNKVPKKSIETQSVKNKKEGSEISETDVESEDLNESPGDEVYKKMVSDNLKKN